MSEYHATAHSWAVVGGNDVPAQTVPIDAGLYCIYGWVVID